jgi:glycosyltransferase involved in cell wall biosynthesis
MAKVSVVIPSYNHDQFIHEAVSSVLDQSERDLELIVVDDGSTDETLKILSDFDDRRMQVFAQQNQGAHAAINNGLQKTTGFYLSILNSDDVYPSNRLERLIAVLEEDPEISLACSYIEVIDAKGKRLGIKEGYRSLEPWALDEPEHSFRTWADLRGALFTENYLATTSNYVFRRSTYDQVGSFRKLRYAHDWDFALRVSKVGRISLLREALLRYRIHERNTIREDQAVMILEICWCLAVHLPDLMNAPWFEEVPYAERIDVLLHSIYTFGFDRVLNVMLLQNLAVDSNKSERILDVNDPGRMMYLDFIHRQLALVGGSKIGQRRMPLAPSGERASKWRLQFGKWLVKIKDYLRE